MVRCHTCWDNEQVAQGIKEPPAKKCRCRKFVSLAKATELVRKGEAKWVVVGRTQSQQQEMCPLCQADKKVINCAQCQGSGKVTRNVTFETYNNDIVLVNQESADKDGPYKPNLVKKTPRTETVERVHCERAYVDQDVEEQERIEIYGLMILEERIRMGIGITPEENVDWGRPGILHHN